ALAALLLQHAPGQEQRPYERRPSRARLSSLASVGNITAFGCTVVSITTRARSDGFIASVRVATARLSCNSALSLSSPIRWRQRVSDERSNTNACWKNSSPQKYWKYRFSTQRSTKPPPERSWVSLRIASPAISRVGNGGWPGLSV